MEIYIKIFEVIFPVFFVIGIGYYLGKKNPKFDTNFIISKEVASRIGLNGKYEDIQNYKIRGRKEGMDLVKIYS